MRTAVASIALVGDLHGHWDAEDVGYFNASDYDLLLFTGDLGSGTRKDGLAIARSVARLNKRALVVAGNNDAPFGSEIAAEFRLQGGLTTLMRLTAGHALSSQSEGHVQLCGYCTQHVQLPGLELSIVVGRPYAMGGSELSFAEALAERHGITNLAQSRHRLCALIEQAPTQDLILLAHNGPAGLGAEMTSIWGCDFRPEAGDWGDEDLLHAVQHAERIGKRVLAVVAGHMHRSSELSRCATLQRASVLYVNPALVPRVFTRDNDVVRHHMALDIGPSGVTVRDVFVR